MRNGIQVGRRGELVISRAREDNVQGGYADEFFLNVLCGYTRFMVLGEKFEQIGFHM